MKTQTPACKRYINSIPPSLLRFIRCSIKRSLDLSLFLSLLCKPTRTSPYCHQSRSPAILYLPPDHPVLLVSCDFLFIFLRFFVFCRDLGRWVLGVLVCFLDEMDAGISSSSEKVRSRLRRRPLQEVAVSKPYLPSMRSTTSFVRGSSSRKNQNVSDLFLFIDPLWMLEVCGFLLWFCGY